MIAWFVRFSTVAMAVAFASTPALVRAQEETQAPDASDMPSDASVTSQSESGPGTESPKPATQPTTESTQPKQTPPPPKNMAVWALEASGPVGFVLLLMSIAAVALTVKFVLEMRLTNVIPQNLIIDFENKIKEKKYQEAYEVAKNNSSFLGRVLAAGLSKLSTGYPQAIEAMHEVGEDESMKLEHRLSWLAILGTTGPLLGLLGTVEGIIRSFQTIATSETQPKPNQLAGGISTSLFNTFEGLLVAIIATVAFMLLKNQLARLVLEVGMTSGNLMSRFSSLVRGRPAGTSGQNEQT